MKTILPFLLYCLFTLSVVAQSPNFVPEDFNLTGDAKAAGGYCFELTPAELWKGGAAWYKQQVDLNEPFEMELDLQLGCADGGADGLVFIFYPRTKTGFEGEGIGFGGLRPSLGIELDTYQNHHLSDPEFDHVAIMRDGIPDHRRGVIEPVPLVKNKANVEDCLSHQAKVQWNPKTKILNFFFDGDPRISQRIDLIADVFENNPLVYWGFTAATGGEFNRHLVCIEKTSFSQGEAFDELTELDLLASKKRTLKTVDFENREPSLAGLNIKELNKHVILLIKNPDYNFIIEGHTDNSRSEASNRRLSKERADAVAAYLINKGIHPDRIQTVGYGSEQPIAPNDTPEGRKKNRRIVVSMQKKRV